MEAGHCSTEGAPRNAVAGVVEAGKRTAEALHPRKHAVLGDLAVLEDEFRGDARLQRMLSLHLWRGESRVVLLDDEAANDAVKFGPDHGEVGDAAVGDPHLGTVEEVMVPHVLGFGDHVAWVGTVIGLGQPKATDEFA